MEIIFAEDLNGYGSLLIVIGTIHGCNIREKRVMAENKDINFYASKNNGFNIVALLLSLN